MATLGDLKTRIIAETDRDDLSAGDDLEDTLTLCINRAIEFYSNETFWFNEAGAIVSATGATSAGVGYIALPGSVRIAEKVFYGTTELYRYGLGDLVGLTDSGIPSRWASNGDNIQLHPIPDAAYTLNVYGLAQVDAPTSDSDSTIWTNEAYDLIAARTRFLLFRDVSRDVEGTQLAAQAEGEALSRLRSETRKRNVTPLRSDLSDGRSYNIATG